ncbi:MAG: 50S ribosomal protein L3 [candidate division Zixibacteria bacterium DG_27]|nr:MAG: 50S ribosomal protein L3 [candidate division Zixibacteria bacterium DG_27]
MRTMLGRKVGMTRVFDENGEVVPATVIEAGPCSVVQVKTPENDSYSAVQLGFGKIRSKLVSKPMGGHFKKAGLEPSRWLREGEISPEEAVKVGEMLTVDVFKVGDKVNVTGTTKGLGFQGGVRRHHFRGGPKTHGQSDRLRAPGSIGASSYPSRVWKGTRMAGQMGNVRQTVKNLTVVAVDPKSNLLLLRGSVPGKINNLLKITLSKRGMEV